MSVFYCTFVNGGNCFQCSRNHLQSIFCWDVRVNLKLEWITRFRLINWYLITTAIAKQSSLDEVISFISAKKRCIAFQCGWKSHKTVCGFCRMMIVDLAMGTKHHQVLPLLIADLNSRASWLLRGLYSAWYHLCAFRVKLLWKKTHTLQLANLQ